MELPNSECYNMFNDYLGLSNVVGQSDDPFCLVDSIISSKSGIDQREFRGRHATHGCAKQNENAPVYDKASPSFAVSGYKRQNVEMSDAERLFGKTSNFQKYAYTRNANMPDTSTTHIATESMNKCNKSIRTEHHVSHATSQLLESQIAHISHVVARENAIRAALDAITYKYDCLYERKSEAKNGSFKAQPLPGSNDRWINVATLTAALAKVAASYEEQQGASNLKLTNDALRTTANKTPMESPQPRFIGCSFCKNNKEVEEWYLSHQLKDTVGRVTCPVLRCYTCPLCHATGDNAHTIGHCPLNPDRRNSLPLAIRTKANAAGKKKNT